mmetsp:Transcript_23988/g.55955  ORF Transcript_23988/g.55955 Transcript_23988/m.55955 type:complete len:109 (-) Transcript_23988:239-565(-)
MVEGNGKQQEIALKDIHDQLNEQFEWCKEKLSSIETQMNNVMTEMMLQKDEEKGADGNDLTMTPKSIKRRTYKNAHNDSCFLARIPLSKTQPRFASRHDHTGTGWNET